MTPQQESITLEDVKAGVVLAQDDFEHGVLAETYKELSDGDRAFLSAMLPDEKSSTINDIATRMGQSDGYARVYRGRLLKQGLIVEEDRGRVSFGLPFLRDFIEKKKKRR